MKRGLVVSLVVFLSLSLVVFLSLSLVVFLSLSLGGCSIDSLEKEDVENNVSVLSNDESSEEGSKLNDTLNKITNNNEGSQIVKEENQIVKEDIVSNEKNTVRSDDKVEVKETEENLIDEANIQKAKKEILKHATYLNENLIYEDFVNINDHISGMDEEVNVLRGVKV